nr:hypothetical protein [Bacteroidota bacterium]
MVFQTSFRFDRKEYISELPCMPYRQPLKLKKKYENNSNVIDKETNEITTVSSDYLKELLFENPELLEEYEKEEDTINQEVIIKYLKILNEQGQQ